MLQIHLGFAMGGKHQLMLTKNHAYFHKSMTDSQLTLIYVQFNHINKYIDHDYYDAP